MSNYYKNFILCGDVDYFCLLCEESFENVDEVEKHIRWERHRKLIKAKECVSSFKKDGIYKVQKLYYCEHCNVTMSYGLEDHIKHKSHTDNKSNSDKIKQESLAKRDQGFVIVSKYALTKKEWHGIIDEFCIFCSTSGKNMEAHLKLVKHRIAFTQALVKKTEDGHYYRQISEFSFYCFECKETFSMKSMDTHWTSDEHCSKKVTEQKSLFDIDKENFLATCTICKKVVNLSWISLYSHQDMHIENKEWPSNKESTSIDYQQYFDDHGKYRAYLKRFGKDNFIKLTQGGVKGYCSLCHTYISPHITNFKQHVSGIRHMNHLEVKGLIKKSKKTEKPKYKTKPLSSVFKDIVLVKNAGCFFINQQLSIDFLSFMFLAASEEAEKIICYVCDGKFPDAKSHIDSKHKEKLFKADIVVTSKDEFIREIRPNVYHCGICNTVYAGWSVLEKHLNTFKHRFAKMESIKGLEEFVENNQGNVDCSCDISPEIKTVDILD